MYQSVPEILCSGHPLRGPNSVPDHNQQRSQGSTIDQVIGAKEGEGHKLYRPRGVEERLIAEEKEEVGVEVVIVYPSFLIGGSAVDFEAAFRFDDVISS